MIHNTQLFTLSGPAGATKITFPGNLNVGQIGRTIVVNNKRISISKNFYLGLKIVVVKPRMKIEIKSRYEITSVDLKTGEEYKCIKKTKTINITTKWFDLTSMLPNRLMKDPHYNTVNETYTAEITKGNLLAIAEIYNALTEIERIYL